MRHWVEKLKAEKKEQILILLLAGILLLVIAIPTQEGQEENAVQTETGEQERAQASRVETRAEQLEERLMRILSHVEGIGKTEVMITLRSNGRRIVEKDLEHSEGKEESSGEGDSTSTSELADNESTVFMRDAQGSESPYVTEELEPEIEGVLVIAQGAGNPAAVTEITEAVMALFGVEAHKIKVMKME